MHWVSFELESLLAECDPYYWCGGSGLRADTRIVSAHMEKGEVAPTTISGWYRSDRIKLFSGPFAKSVLTLSCEKRTTMR